MSTAAQSPRITRTFASTVGTAPTSVWHVPELASLLGEHTGASGGLALPLALPWGPSAAVALAEDGIVEVHPPLAGTAPLRRPLTELLGDPAPVPAWAAPAWSALRLLTEAGCLPEPVPGLRVCLDKLTRPGTAAASAAECAVLLCLAEALGHNELIAEPRALAELGGSADESTATRGGVLARSAALRCRAEHVLVLDLHGHGGRGVPLPLDEHGLCLLVVDPGADGVRAPATDWWAECAEAATTLGVATLRDVAEEPDLGVVLARLPDATARRRVQHVVTEIHRVNAAAGLLRMGAVAELGAVLNTAHLSLRDQLECTAPEVDLTVETAVRSGARGARLSGEPDAGRVLVLAPVDRAGEIETQLGAAHMAKGWTEPVVRMVRAAGAGPSRPL